MPTFVTSEVMDASPQFEGDNFSAGNSFPYQPPVPAAGASRRCQPPVPVASTDCQYQLRVLVDSTSGQY